MDIRQKLYKATISIKSRRDIQKEKRYNRRQEEFQQRRSISVSPETAQSNIQQTNIAAIQGDSVLSRQRTYVARLKDWKKQKQEANKENINKTKPFVPAGAGSSKNVLCQTEKHKPIKSDTVKKRQSTYALKTTTVNVNSNSSNQLKPTVFMNSKSAAKNFPSLEGPNTSTMKNITKTSEHINKPKTLMKQPIIKQENNTTRNHLKKSRDVLPFKPIPKVQAQVQPKSVVNQSKGNLRRITAKEDVNKNAKIKLGTNMKAKKEINLQSGKSNLGRIPKTHLKSIATEIRETSKNIKSNSNEMFVTSNRFKSSKNNKACSKNIKSSCSNNVASIQSAVQPERVGRKSKFTRYSLAFAEDNEKETTLSTKSLKEYDSDKLTLRNNEAGELNDYKLTPKKNLTEDCNLECISTDSNPMTNKLDGVVPKYQQQQQTLWDKPSVKKFSFIRYSLAEESDKTESTDIENENVNERDNENDSYRSILEKGEEEVATSNQLMPTKGSVKLPLTYLSPFVSVARGKVNRKMEECKRQSITDANSMTSNLDGLRFYRQQLQKETEDLQNLCETWEQYKQDNQMLLEAVNGDDMINATLGQTRLLINKKFKQFSQLIDRCEKNIYNSIEGSDSNVPLEDDGSENTKPITLRDLEGFWWSMIKLQLDNLEKRFENLNRWKANDWKDPDELIQTEQSTVKNVNKICKVNKKKNSNKIKATSTAAAFIAMMRKNQVEKLKQQQKHNVNDFDVISIPSEIDKGDNLSSSTAILQSPSKQQQQQSSWDKPPVKKFNFIRYSLREENDETESTHMEDETVNKLLKKSDKENDSDRSFLNNNKQNMPTGNQSTPTGDGMRQPLTYLSPFVSVARGKVNRKMEESKRKCITDINPMTNNLDGIRFYRQQLQKETEDLQNLCETWEQYKQDNQMLLEAVNGDDMINATLGQTRLLINKKFKQFSQLIDRCEKNIYNSIEGADSNVPLEDDDSENTRPITLRDLEGFWWSMIKLQLDNLEKRFENLNRWKVNDWKDPDELMQTEQSTVKNVNKMCKVNKKKNSNKIKATSNAAAFIAMMRKNQVKKLKQQEHNENDCDVILTPSKSNARNDTSSLIMGLSPSKQQQQQQQTQKKHHIVIVRDRKYMSPSVTRLLLPGPKPSPRLSSTPLQRTALHQYSPSNLSSAIQEFNKSIENLNALTNNSSCKKKNSSNLKDFAQISSARKSILKTPGTPRSKVKNVLFDDKLRVKPYKFIVTDDVISVSSASTYEEDMEQCIQEEDNQSVCKM